MSGRAFVLVILTAGGCAGTGPTVAQEGTEAPAETPARDPVESMAGDPLRIECDRARVVVPERLRDRVSESAPGARPCRVTVGNLCIETRETPPEVVVKGESFSVVAEGVVVFHREKAGADMSEGPYRTVVIRDGRVLLR